MTEQEPWAFIAHKDGSWAGVVAADSPPKHLRKFLGDFAADGFAIMTVHSREEYLAALKTMTFWNRPEKSDPPMRIPAHADEHDLAEGAIKPVEGK